jgi:hypothetical protein
MGAVAPKSGVLLSLQMSEIRIRIRLLWIYFPWIAEFGSASEFRGGGVNPPQTPSLRHWTEVVRAGVVVALLLRKELEKKRKRGNLGKCG